MLLTSSNIKCFLKAIIKSILYTQNAVQRLKVIKHPFFKNEIAIIVNNEIFDLSELHFFEILDTASYQELLRWKLVVKDNKKYMDFMDSELQYRSDLLHNGSAINDLFLRFNNSVSISTTYDIETYVRSLDNIDYTLYIKDNQIMIDKNEINVLKVPYAKC
jgi:uncharacterized protein YjbK